MMSTFFLNNGKTVIPATSTTTAPGRKVEKRVCRVGYAMNAKKLRKSHPVPNPTEGSSKEETVQVTSSSSSSAPKRRLNGQVNRPWRGGGLADILVSQPSDTEAEEDLADSENSDCEDRVVRFYPFKFPNTQSTQTAGLQESEQEETKQQREDFQVLIHKLTDDIEKKDPVGRLSLIRKYIEKERGYEVVLVDPFEAVANVTSRSRTCETLKGIIQRMSCLSSPSSSSYATSLFTSLRSQTPAMKSLKAPFSIPRYILVEREMSDETVLEAMQENALTFPVICKPVEACGTPNSHSMVSEQMLFFFFSSVPFFLFNNSVCHTHSFSRWYSSQKLICT